MTDINKNEIKDFINDMKTEIENAGRACMILNQAYVDQVNEKKKILEGLRFIQKQLDAAQMCMDEDIPSGARKYVFTAKQKLKELLA